MGIKQNNDLDFDNRIRILNLPNPVQDREPSTKLYVDSIYNDLSSDINTLNTNLTNYINTNITNLQNYINTSIGNLQNYVDTQDASIYSYINNQINTTNTNLTNYIDSQINSLNTSLTSYINSINSSLSSRITVTEQQLNGNLAAYNMRIFNLTVAATSSSEFTTPAVLHLSAPDPSLNGYAATFRSWYISSEAFGYLNFKVRTSPTTLKTLMFLSENNDAFFSASSIDGSSEISSYVRGRNHFGISMKTKNIYLEAKERIVLATGVYQDSTGWKFSYPPTYQGLFRGYVLYFEPSLNDAYGRGYYSSSLYMFRTALGAHAADSAATLTDFRFILPTIIPTSANPEISSNIIYFPSGDFVIAFYKITTYTNTINLSFNVVFDSPPIVLGYISNSVNPDYIYTVNITNITTSGCTIKKKYYSGTSIFDAWSEPVNVVVFGRVSSSL